MSDFKTKLDYTVRSTRAPGATEDTYVPALVDRLQPRDLQGVIENCIDRGLIAGLKPTAAQTIAEGIAAQMAKEFSEGNGVQFGQYFYGRPYLSGTVDGNGRLSGDNEINVRLYKGNAFKLDRKDYSLTFVDEGNNPKITSIVSEDAKPRGTIVKGSAVVINGSMLYAAGDTIAVRFKNDVAEDVVVAQTAMSTYGSDLLKFTCPAALVPTATYDVVVERTDENGVKRTSNAKSVTVEAGNSPVITKVTTDYPDPLPEGYDPNAVVVEDMPGMIYGENLDPSTAVVKLVSSTTQEETLEIIDSGEGYLQYGPPTGEKGNPCAIMVTTAVGETTFIVKYYSPE